jgi:hypothetical protein
MVCTVQEWHGVGIFEILKGASDLVFLITLWRGAKCRYCKYLSLVLTLASVTVTGFGMSL